MSMFKNTLKTCNILDIINGGISQKYSENYIEYITNINKDIILLLVDNS